MVGASACRVYVQRHSIASNNHAVRSDIRGLRLCIHEVHNDTRGLAPADMAHKLRAVHSDMRAVRETQPWLESDDMVVRSDAPSLAR